MKAIRIHVEGGGEQKDKKLELRKGMGQFLSSIRTLARSRNINWDIIVCGSRQSAFEAFKTALRKHPDAFNILLVDSENLVKSRPWAHLRERDGWHKPAKVTEDHCHLMAQAMEAWLIADPETLIAFYGQGFNPNQIPKTQDVETVEKVRLAASLRDATRHSAKGFYHKTRHAPLLLEKLNVETVKSKARHCDRLFQTLTQIME